MDRRIVVLVAGGVCVALAALTISPKLRQGIGGLCLGSRVTYSVDDRLRQYGPAARARLAPYFAAGQVPYPPSRLVLVGMKQERKLAVYAAGTDGGLRFIRSYPILAASGTLGPKLREGDCQVPEGVYRLESLNPNSLYHLALRVGYPNDFDRAAAARDGRDNLGGDIMIHGSNASVGCLAMGDPASEDLFVLAADIGIDKVRILLTPLDFRGNPRPAGLPAEPGWVKELYGQLRSEMGQLPPPSSDRE